MQAIFKRCTKFNTRSSLAKGGIFHNNRRIVLHFFRHTTNKSSLYLWLFALPYLFPAFCAFFFRLIFPLVFPRRTLPPYCDARSVIRRRSISAAFASGLTEILKICCLCLHNNYTFLSLGKHNAVRCNSRPQLYIRPDSAFIGKITLYFVFRQLKTITNYAVTLLCIIHKHK